MRPGFLSPPRVIERLLIRVNLWAGRLSYHTLIHLFFDLSLCIRYTCSKTSLVQGNSRLKSDVGKKLFCYFYFRWKPKLIPQEKFEVKRAEGNPISSLANPVKEIFCWISWALVEKNCNGQTFDNKNSEDAYFGILKTRLEIKDYRLKYELQNNLFVIIIY